MHSSWSITLEDGTVLEVGKLPPSFFSAQAKAEGVDYWNVYYGHPAASIERFDAILDAFAAKLGIERPTFEDMDSFQDFTEDPEKIAPPVQKISDEPVFDGFPQMPGETGSSTSSSGSPGDSDGPRA